MKNGGRVAADPEEGRRGRLEARAPRPNDTNQAGDTPARQRVAIAAGAEIPDRPPPPAAWSAHVTRLGPDRALTNFRRAGVVAIVTLSRRERS